MESFAHYAFNKSHAAAYANISYKTAWLKCHYPREYMAALLSSVLDNQNKLASYITECKRLGIRVLPPNVNESNLHFTVSGNDIRYGLLAVKNLGRNFIDEIISERLNNPYEDFFDFCKRLYGRNMNSRAIESLIKCGAFDGLGANRRQLLAISKTVLDDVEYESRLRNPYAAMSIVVNARAVCESQVMGEVMEDALDAIKAQYDLKCNIIFTECFGFADEGRRNGGRASRYAGSGLE